MMQVPRVLGGCIFLEFELIFCISLFFNLYFAIYPESLVFLSLKIHMWFCSVCVWVNYEF